MIRPGLQSGVMVPSVEAEWLHVVLTQRRVSSGPIGVAPEIRAVRAIDLVLTAPVPVGVLDVAELLDAEGLEAFGEGVEAVVKAGAQ